MKKIIEHSPNFILFSYLVDYKSFTALAERLNVNKSVVSKRISDLERHLGTQLLIRSTRRLNLTDAGKLLYQKMQQVQKDLDIIYTEVDNLSNMPKGTLRISASNNFAQEHLTPLITQFSEHYPHIKFKLFIGRSYQCVIQNSIDIGFHIGPLPDSNLTARKLATRKPIICGSPRYFIKHPAPKTLEELQEHNCLLFMPNKNSAHWKLINEEKKEVSVDVSGNFHTTSTQVLKSAVMNHLGVAMLPEHLVTSELKEGKLQLVLENYDAKSIDIYALYTKPTLLTRRARLFLDFVTQTLSETSYWC